MLSFALKRLAGAIPTIFIIISLAFFMIRLAPGGPFDTERPLDPVIMQNIKQTYGLDLPLWQQYLNYIGNLLRGDLGPSLVRRDFTVNELLGLGLPVSVMLGGIALLVAAILGTILGTIAALRQNSWIDYLIVGVATFGITTPNFVVAPILSLLFGVILGVLPAGGWSINDLSTWVLPIVTLALPQVAVIARLVRGATVEALRANHIRTARAYGLPTRTVVGVHALRAAILPAVSYLGPTAAGLMTGSVVVETIFGISGIGRYFVQGALGRDYTVVMGTVVIIAIFIVVFNLIVDLAYALLDPRVRYD